MSQKTPGQHARQSCQPRRGSHDAALLPRQSTPLSATKNHTYIEGLNDSGGSIAITVNDYAEFRTAWENCINAYDALTGGKEMWFEIAYPAGADLDSFYFPGKPLPLGFGGADVDSVLENNANILPTGDYEFGAASVTSA